MAGKKGIKHYPRELKLEAIRLFFEAGMTKREIVEALGVNDKRRVQKWLQKYRAEGEAAFLPLPKHEIDLITTGKIHPSPIGPTGLNQALWIRSLDRLFHPEPSSGVPIQLKAETRSIWNLCEAIHYSNRL